MQTLSSLFLISLLSFSSLHSNELKEHVLYKLVQDARKSNLEVKRLSVELQLSNRKITHLEEKMRKLADAVYPIDLSKEKPVEPTSTKKKRIVINSAGIVSIEPVSSKKKFNRYVVTAWGLNIRIAPNKESKIIDRLVMGDLIKAFEYVEGWYRTEVGYVNATYISRSKLTDTQRVLVKKMANLRSTPFLGKNIVDTLEKGETRQVLLTLFNKSWYKLNDENLYVYKGSVRVAGE